MAKKNRITCDFSGFEEIAEKIDKLGGNKLKQAVSESLEKSYDFVTKNAKKDIKPHNKTGDTAKSLRDHEKVKWEGNEGYIDVGFDIKYGGFPSIFLMYGTARHAPHPGTKEDKKLYNDIYGTNTKNKIKKIQKETMESFLNKNP